MSDAKYAPSGGWERLLPPEKAPRGLSGNVEVYAMAQTKGTGSWEVPKGDYPRKTSNFDRTYRMRVKAGPEYTSAPTVAFAVAESWSECKANAALIAAAPDLLAALEQAVAAIEQCGAHRSVEFIGSLKAAIAKAQPPAEKKRG